MINMADSNTEKWALKSKQIEAERMKAARDLNESQKLDKANVAFLDPKTTKVKGWSSDPDVIVADIERMGNRALILAVAGIILCLIGSIGEITSSSFKLGLGGAIISALPSGIGYLCLGTAMLLALIAVGGGLFLKIKKGTKLTFSFWTGVSTIALVILFYVIQTLLLRSK